jgi:hypothetical protein
MLARMYRRTVFKQGNVWRDFLPAFVIVVNSLTWNTFVLTLFSSTIRDLSIPDIGKMSLWGVEYAGIAISAIAGSMFFPRSRKSSLFVWMVAGAVISLMLVTIPHNDMMLNVLISFLFGVSVGAGLPSSLACFADTTIVENRGFFGGITFLFVGIITMLLVMTMLLLGNAMAFLIVFAWRMIGSLLYLSVSRERESKKEENVPSYSSILGKHELILYLVPWVMFCLVNWMEAPLIQNLFGELYSLAEFMAVVIAGLFAMVGGTIADFAGRKRVVIMGFVILGLEYALLSFLWGMSVSLYVYTAFDGIAWGMLASVFFMTLWGDLAENYQKDKYYVVGGLPYLLATFLSILVKPYVGVTPLSAAFSLASFFLFLAVVPLMYAHETLPERKIRDRELKEYVEKAKRVKEKYA